MDFRPDDAIFRARPEWAGPEERSDSWPALPIVVWAAMAGIGMVSAVACGLLVFLLPLLAIVLLPPLVMGLLAYNYRFPFGLWLATTGIAALFLAGLEFMGGMRIVAWVMSVGAITFYGARFTDRQLTANRSLLDQLRVLFQETSAPRTDGSARRTRWAASRRGRG